MWRIILCFSAGATHGQFSGIKNIGVTFQMWRIILD
jgi:hypothetical protein